MPRTVSLTPRLACSPGIKDATKTYDTQPLCYDCILSGQKQHAVAECAGSCAKCKEHHLMPNYVKYEAYVDERMGYWQVLTYHTMT